MENLAHLQEEVQRLRDFRHHAENKLGALETLFHSFKNNCQACTASSDINEIKGILVGVDGENGVRGKVKEHASVIDMMSAQIDVLNQKLTLIEYQLGQIMWGIKLLGGLLLTTIAAGLLKLIFIP